MEIVTRFAPSPTGDLHLGGARTALFSWLAARHAGGRFLLRIEDTDRLREKEGSVASILEGLKWLGLHWDGPVVFQSQRMTFYKEFVHKFLNEGHAYFCNCSSERLEKLREAQLNHKVKPKYDGFCAPKGLVGSLEEPGWVVRFKTKSEGICSFNDLVRGKVEVPWNETDDLVIWRGGIGPTYNFCVVMDDWESGVNHVVRGEDHISNTPRQMAIAEALKAPIPTYAHVPMILDQEGGKLSKRRGAENLLHYQKRGFLPEALKNFLVRLGWGYGNQELFTDEMLIQHFTLDRVGSSPSRFNAEKLTWFNQEHIRRLSSEELLDRLEKLRGEPLKFRASLPSSPKQAVELFKPRSTNLLELEHYLTAIDQGPCRLSESEEWVRSFALTVREDQGIFKQFVQVLSELVVWESGSIAKTFSSYARESGMAPSRLGSFCRAALMGLKESPKVSDIFLFLGKEEAIRRCHAFLEASEQLT